MNCSMNYKERIMEGIMDKVVALYEALQVKSLELKAQEAQLKEKRNELDHVSSGLDAREKDLKAEEKRVKRVADVIEAETLLAARTAEIEMKESQLAAAGEKAEEAARIREAGIAKRDAESRDMAAETLATRQRLLVEVKKVEEMKAKYKEDVLAQLKGM